jgi:hypothetical protein
MEGKAHTNSELLHALPRAWFKTVQMQIPYIPGTAAAVSCGHLSDFERGDMVNLFTGKKQKTNGTPGF